MTTDEIRSKFLEFFSDRGHEVRPSSPLVPADDPTLLFTNSGMVQFKTMLLSIGEVPFKRAVTSQKCLRAGGKHNDLEEVGNTARHHTFFEMLGNFSFGDYFKRDAIAYAWEFLTKELGLDADRLFISIHHSDDEAYELWQEITGVSAERIFRLGDEDNFWQMADTGPCGPCSELHYDLRPKELRGELSLEEFKELDDQGVLIELWNLVFMQYDRDDNGTLNPLPAPSIDTGAGLERLATVLQDLNSNYDIDVFTPILKAVSDVIGRQYEPGGEEGMSYRVLADHARAVAFLLSDGVFPSNEGRGYVLRRILRRAVRHAWILGRRDPTLVSVVESVIDTMGEAYPELIEQRDHLLNTTRAEEERFLDTIEGGMDRFDQIAPWSEDVEKADSIISGYDAFKLYDTFGFPLDLTQIMAEERGYSVDIEGFEVSLEDQREMSRADRAQSNIGVSGSDFLDGWLELVNDGDQHFLGYEDLEADTEVLAIKISDDVIAMQLADNPFYAEGGGQVSDTGIVVGGNWSIQIQDALRIGNKVAVVGVLSEGSFPEEMESPLQVSAFVERSSRRDTERNHTATHLLHAALRNTLGTHVVQRGSLVTPDRLRFDFAHNDPLTDEEIIMIEGVVNKSIWINLDVTNSYRSYDEAVADGAMALFGEKYADVVRVVEIPEVSIELCGGTHVRHTSEIGLFKITSESGVAAGVRRIEAVTGPGALSYFEKQLELLDEVAEILGVSSVNSATRARQVIDEKQELDILIDDLGGIQGSGETLVLEENILLDELMISYKAVRLRARNVDDVRKWGDAFLTGEKSGVSVVVGILPKGKHALFAFVTDDLISKGLKADEIVQDVATVVGSKGGGRSHMAQAGVEDPDRLDEALRVGCDFVKKFRKHNDS